MEFTLKVTIGDPVPPRVTPEWVREWFQEELENTVDCNMSAAGEMPSIRVDIV